jgi:FixJ family two-component response regulator
LEFGSWDFLPGNIMAVPSPKAVTPTVVIIDDDDSVRRALGRLMRTVGRNVELFASAEEFLQCLNPTTDATDSTDCSTSSVASAISVVPPEGEASHHSLLTTHHSPACLILDLHLPGLSGLELQDHLKILGKNFSIVFITAFTDDHARARALKAGAIAFLYKPFDERALLDAVEKGLAHGKE